ncbi:MAG: GNAT family N-acetyltransferase [Clostridia bacterium]|nr:GNAT family N-acetyltransferase [Clostridia bacterium]
MRLETCRLFIRQLNESDWQEMQKVFIDFNNSKYAIYDMPLPTEDEESKTLTKRFADTKLFFAVFLKNSNDMIGYVCFHKNGDKYDLGYCFHSAYHSNGYAYESADALIKYITTEYGANHFTAGTALDNKPSCKLLKKLSFICISTETVSFNDAFSFQGGNFELRINKKIPI